MSVQGLKQEMPALRRCAIYTRKSTTVGLEQDFNSLDAQRESCEAFIKSQAHQSWVLVDTFEDGGFTGASMERPGFRQLMQAVDEGHIDIVVVYKVDRLSRSLFDFVKVMERFTRREVAFVSVTQNFSTADAMGRLTLNMLMSFAEFERAMIIERTRDKMAAARRKGKWTGGHVPLGYEVLSKRLVVNEEEAWLVGEIYRRYLEDGASALSLVQWLNGAPEPTHGNRIKPRKAPWTQALVLHVLRNRLYLGEVHSHGVYYPGEHPALIDRETFERVQQKLAPQNRYREGRSRRVQPIYILRGILTCAACGKAMTTASSHRKGGVFRYYRCSTRNHQGRKACPTTQVPAEALEAYISDQVVEALSARSVLRHQVEARARAAEDALSQVNAELEDLRAQDRLNLEDLPVLSNLERRTLQLSEEGAEWEWLLAMLQNPGPLWEALTLGNRHRLLRLLIEEATVDEVGHAFRVTFQDLGRAS